MTKRAISRVPDDLVFFLLALGSATGVFLEGETDVEVFQKWYAEFDDRLLFYFAGGVGQVKEKVEAVLAISPQFPVFGITDRDFREDSEVETLLHDPNTKLFILTRYALENYLLDPQWVFKELETACGQRFTINNATEMEAAMLEICRSLKTVMAANWVFSEAERDENILSTHFSFGHELSDREEVLRQAVNRLGNIDETEVRRRIEEKEQRLDSLLTGLNSAHRFTNGKHLLFQIWRRFKNDLANKDALLRYLARNADSIEKIPADIRFIVEQKILGLPAQPSS